MSILIIDFDGTIVTNRWPEIGEPLPGALDALAALRAAGHKIVINTCRSGKPEWAAKEWLALNGVQYDAFNENLPEQIRLYGSDCRKLSGDVYIDDKNLGGFPGWATVMDTLAPRVPGSLCVHAVLGNCVGGYKCDRSPGACSAYKPRVTVTHREPCGKVVKDELCEKCPALKRYSCEVPERSRNFGPSCANCDRRECGILREENSVCGRWFSDAPLPFGQNCNTCRHKSHCGNQLGVRCCPDWRPNE